MFPKRNLNAPSPEIIFTDVASNSWFAPDTLQGRQDFVLNYAGFPRNDISLINELQDVNSIQSLASKLNVLPSSGETDPSVSVDDLLLRTATSRNQSFAEVIDDIERKVEDDYYRELLLQDKSHDEEVVAAAKNRLDSLRNTLSAEERVSIVKRKRDKDIEEFLDKI